MDVDVTFCGQRPRGPSSTSAAGPLRRSGRRPPARGRRPTPGAAGTARPPDPPAPGGDPPGPRRAPPPDPRARPRLGPGSARGGRAEWEEWTGRAGAFEREEKQSPRAPLPAPRVKRPAPPPHPPPPARRDAKSRRRDGRCLHKRRPNPARRQNNASLLKDEEEGHRPPVTSETREGRRGRRGRRARRGVGRENNTGRTVQPPKGVVDRGRWAWARPQGPAGVGGLGPGATHRKTRAPGTESRPLSAGQEGPVVRWVGDGKGEVELRPPDATRQGAVGPQGSSGRSPARFPTGNLVPGKGQRWRGKDTRPPDNSLTVLGKKFTSGILKFTRTGQINPPPPTPMTLVLS